MSIANNYEPVKVSGDGVTVLFSFNFQIYATSDLLVTLIDKTTGAVTSTLALGTDYSVAISSTTEGGTITCVVAPPATKWVLIQSNMAETQPTSFTIDGKFSVVSVERALDRQCRLTQQITDPVNRSIKIPASEAGAGIDLELPPLVAGKVIGISADALSLELFTADSGAAAAEAEAAAAAALASETASASSASSASSSASAASASAAAAAASAASVATMATQAEVEAASSTTTVVNPAKMKFHPGIAKVWVLFDGTAGTPAAAASYNVSSITDNGTGDYTINFSTAFSSANFAAIGSCYQSAGPVYCNVHPKTFAVGSVRIETATVTTDVPADATNISLACYGDQ